MAELGAYYITIMPSMKGFTKQVNSQLSSLGTESGKGFSGGFADVLKGSAFGTVLGNLATEVGNSLASGLSTGIYRLDTIKNFPKVMEGLGYSADEAGVSIQTIMDHLDGLPTATQDMVTLTQAISDSTGDLDLATRAALGFNDMMLANGSSAEEMSIAQAVLNRVLGKGSATAAQWASLTSVMPAQLGQVARHMLGATASTEDLHEALEDGTVSWNDFLKAIVELDETGEGSMDSFYQQAVNNSVGIGTALENIPNRIGAGWAAILDVLGQEEISGVINKISYGIRDSMVALAGAIDDLKKRLGDNKVFQNAKKIFNDLKDSFGGLGDAAKTKLGDAVDGLADLIGDGLQWIVDHGDFCKSALVGIAAGLGALIVAKTVSGAVAGLSLALEVLSMVSGAGGIVALLGNLGAAFQLLAESGGLLSGVLGGLGSIFTWIAANPIVVLIAAFAAITAGLIYFFTQTEKGKEIWQGFCTLLSETWQGLQEDWSYLSGVISREWENMKTSISTTCDNIKKAVTDKWNGIKTAVSGKVDEIKRAISTKWEETKTNVSTTVDGIKTAVTDKWNGIKTSVSGIVDGIKLAITTKIDAAKTAVLNTFDRIKNGIVEKLNWAKTQVSGIVDKIKGVFNFSWSLPRPSIPKINWHWESVGGLLRIPHFDGVTWMAKGGIFDSASIIGIGEAGREAALPLNKHTYGEIARGISGEMNPAASGDVIVTGNTFVIREEADVKKVAIELNRLTARERMAAV